MGIILSWLCIEVFFLSQEFVWLMFRTIFYAKNTSLKISKVKCFLSYSNFDWNVCNNNNENLSSTHSHWHPYVERSTSEQIRDLCVYFDYVKPTRRKVMWENQLASSYCLVSNSISVPTRLTVQWVCVGLSHCDAVSAAMIIVNLSTHLFGIEFQFSI